MDIRYTAKAQKDVRKLGPAAELILAKIEQYAENPSSLRNNVKALKGQEAFRLRVGDYRVVFVIEDDLITVMVVMAIRHRRHAYD